MYDRTLNCQNQYLIYTHWNLHRRNVSLKGWCNLTSHLLRLEQRLTWPHISVYVLTLRQLAYMFNLQSQWHVLIWTVHFPFRFELGSGSGRWDPPITIGRKILPVWLHVSGAIRHTFRMYLRGIVTICIC